MKTYYHNQYKIEINNDRTYTIGSVDNRITYDLEYSDSDCKNIRPSSIHSVIAYENEKILKSAIICCCDGGSTGIHDNSAIINVDNFVICVGSYLYSLDIPSLKLNWSVKVDSATCFGIYLHNNKFIVHGELEISQLNQDGEIEWQFGGQDIFATESSDNIFSIHDNYITAFDFENTKYHIDFDGNGRIVKNG